jgi:hypothetical protein
MFWRSLPSIGLARSVQLPLFCVTSNVLPYTSEKYIFIYIYIYFIFAVLRALTPGVCKAWHSSVRRLINRAVSLLAAALIIVLIGSGVKLQICRIRELQRG